VSQYLWSELRRRAGRTVSTALGVAIGVALFIALTAAGAGFQEAARRPLAGVGADILLSRLASENESVAATQTTRGARLPFGVSTLNLSDIEKVRQFKGVDAAAGALLLWDFGAANYQTVLGVDVNQPAVGPAKAREWVVAGRFLQLNDTRKAVVDKHYAAFFGLKPGDEVKIAGEPFQIVGIVEAQEGSQAAAANFYIPLADAQMLAHLNPDAINQIYVRVAQATMVDDVVQQSRAALGEVNATTEQSIVQVIGGIALVSQRFAGVASFVALLGGLVLTGLALSASVAERKREIGVMKTVGWTAAVVRRYFVIEGLTITMAGALVGVLLGWLTTMALGLLPIDLSALNAANTPLGLAVAPAVSETLTLPVTVTIVPLVLALGVAIIGGAVASWLAARRAANLKPAEALRQ
jgi:putative ABC transport system permease protein